MKKYLVLSVFLLTVFLYSCGTAANQRANSMLSEIIKKDYSYEKTYFETHDILFEIHLENTGHSQSAAKLVERLVYGNMNFDEYAEYLENRFIGNLNSDDFILFINESGIQRAFQSSLIENYKVEYYDNDFIILFYTTYSYKSGNAHGDSLSLYYIIDIAQEKILEINDILSPVPDSVLTEIIAKKYGIDNFLRENIWPPDSISVISDGVILLWNVYSIAPHSTGAVSVTIPNSTANIYLTQKGKQLIENTGRR